LIGGKPGPSSPSAKGGFRFVYLFAELLMFSLLFRMRSGPKYDCLKLAHRCALVLLLCVGVAMAGCGAVGGAGRGSGAIEGGTPGTPAGNYTLVVSGAFSSGSTTVTRNSNLILLIQ
jgi:hypothetical protein